MNKTDLVCTIFLIVAFGGAAILSFFGFLDDKPPARDELEAIIIDGKLEYKVEKLPMGRRTRTDVARFEIEGRKFGFKGPEFDECLKAFDSERKKVINVAPADFPHPRVFWGIEKENSTGQMEPVLSYEDCIALETRQTGMVFWLSLALAVVAAGPLVYKQGKARKENDGAEGGASKVV